MPREKRPRGTKKSRPYIRPRGHTTGPPQFRMKGKNIVPKNMNQVTARSRRTPLRSQRVARRWMCRRTRPSGKGSAAGGADAIGAWTTALPQELQNWAQGASEVPQRSQYTAEPSWPMTRPSGRKVPWFIRIRRRVGARRRRRRRVRGRCRRGRECLRRRDGQSA